MLKLKKTPLFLLIFLFVICPTICAKAVIPSGVTVGVGLKLSGVMVTGISEITAEDNKKYNPARECGLKLGDTITKLNGNVIETTDELAQVVEKEGGNTIEAEVFSGDKTKFLKINAKLSKEDGKYKIGAWVKDSTSGIGTLTFYEPETQNYGALGHAITDADTGKVIKASGGEILRAAIISVKKGIKGSPGELKGIFLADTQNLGSVVQNNEYGIFGKLNEPCPSNEIGEIIETAERSEITVGEAYILSNTDGEKPEKYKIDIQKIMQQTTENSKSMVIKVNDARLIEKTGGIVQGMSGSPIIQNDKLVGAVTHVFVNDPTRGYGIFIDWMLEGTS